MLIRVSGHHDGVKQYLEDGRKVGREFTRDEMDERIVLDGDLDLTESIYRMIDAAPNVDRYLTITLSFKEDHIDRETLDAVVRDFKEFVFAAYRPDELNFYAEAHLPRVKSYVDEKTGTLVERKPHVHVVIPKLNLISGQSARPFGFEKLNLDYIDAIQEHLNAKYGLASPKDNRRTEFSDASEMLSRYRGDLFRADSRQLKERILDAMLDRHVEHVDDFMALLAEHGAVRVRNAGREDAYPNVNPAGAEKGVNLKDYVFSREFIELPTDEKLLQLAADAAEHYIERQPARATPEDIQARLDEWLGERAREVKYLNSGNTLQWQRYQQSSSGDRRLMLDALERGFYAQHLKEFHDDTSGFGRLAPDDIDRTFDTPFNDDDGWSDPSAGPNLDGPGGPGFDPGPPGVSPAPAIDADEFGAWPGEPELVAEPVDPVRALSGSDLVSVAEGRPVLLPDPAHEHVDDAGAVSPYRLRRVHDRDREIAPERGSTGRVADSAISQAARDAREARRQRAGNGEFAKIRQQLSGERLLAELSHSHGVLPQKYVVTVARDGAERIRAGRRNLNVSDFLTKELNLSWNEAASLLRESYARQRAGEPVPRARELPRAVLWREFATERDAHARARRAAWEAQKDHEHARRAAIAADLAERRTQIRQAPQMRQPERRQALAAARLNRAAADTALSAQIRRERDALKARYGAATGPTFTAWLQQRAQRGDERALAELRRTRKPSDSDRTSTHTPVNTIRPGTPGPYDDNAILFHGPELSLSVDEGGSVSYRRDGQTLVVDRGDAVDVLQIDRAAIETGLRLAQMKFGRTLELDGNEEFRQAAIEVAAAAGLPVQFSEPELNRAFANARSARVDKQLTDVRESIGGRDDVSRPVSPAAPQPATQPTDATVDPKPRGPRL
ncbi:hypothetical protein FPJ27_37070 (plasmid) [Burkholderia sp. MS455]|uniref:LPD7 domain-containing protein n=1 Tax=Burkholderia sp. MS455 TaxID=2811788 RepID=UPI00195B5AAA|nr:LPD7 domain-containing protein [Burkholderia sp. MS455]QRR11817.1 hypothetical protein FPJ27_37070 [Burkholderia sp. MS455]